MKKLLSLLSVLTISGTAVPTTIAASPKKEETIKNSDINYQQTNNLEVLNRNKRSNERKFEKNFRFASSDSNKARLSYEDVKLINYYYQFQKKNEFIKSVLGILKSLPQVDNTGWGGSITEDDYQVVAEGIWEKYSLFHEILLNLISEGRINGITFVRLHSGEYYEDKYTVLETGGIYD